MIKTWRNMSSHKITKLSPMGKFLNPLDGQVGLGARHDSYFLSTLESSEFAWNSWQVATLDLL